MIRIEGFTKRFGNFEAVQDLVLEVPQGVIYGLIGPNGAGKTTTFRFLATLLRPTHGRAWIDGVDVMRQFKKVRRLIGYMPDEIGLYEGMRIGEYLDFFAATFRIPLRKRSGLIGDVLELLDLTAKRDDFVDGLSRGMRQRLALAKTLLHDPKVLILDEPASGLDPRARLEIKELLKELRDMGKTILISSHILSELSDLCDYIGIIERGRLLTSGPIEEIRGAIRQHRVIELSLTEESQALETILNSDSDVLNTEISGNVARIDYAGSDEALVELHRRLVQADLPVLWLREIETDLEEVFLTVTKGEVA
jgi:ABC-2 type transport system ATP-binding protein